MCRLVSLGLLYTTDSTFKEVSITLQVEFRFDFIAPKFCLEDGAFDTCPAGATMLMIDKEFTKVQDFVFNSII